MEKEKIGKTKNQGHIKWMVVLMKLIELIINLVKNQKKADQTKEPEKQ
jgi:hypothetical protein